MVVLVNTFFLKDLFSLSLFRDVSLPKIKNKKKSERNDKKNWFALWKANIVPDIGSALARHLICIISNTWWNILSKGLDGDGHHVGDHTTNNDDKMIDIDNDNDEDNSDNGNIDNNNNNYVIMIMVIILVVITQQQQ